MRHYYSLESAHLQGAWLTIGSFDGVHRGHQAITKQLTAGAHQQGAPAAVLTFYPHPAIVLGKRSDPFYLTSPRERAELLGLMGVDIVITHPFDLHLANLSAYDFMKYVQEYLDIRCLWIGYDFALGRGRQGNAEKLRQIGLELNYQVHVIEPITVNGEVISSSQIRSCLGNGDVQQVADLLGRPYRISGEVIQGDHRGHSLGFPTANLNVWTERAIPKAGVYICQSVVAGKTYATVTNIGVRPTFDESQRNSPSVEAHLLDFDQDIYGQTIDLDFIDRLRDEQHFPTPQALIAQVQQDIAQARKIL